MRARLCDLGQRRDVGAALGCGIPSFERIARTGRGRQCAVRRSVRNALGFRRDRTAVCGERNGYRILLDRIVEAECDQLHICIIAAFAAREILGVRGQGERAVVSSGIRLIILHLCIRHDFRHDHILQSVILSGTFGMTVAVIRGTAALIADDRQNVALVQIASGGIDDHLSDRRTEIGRRVQIVQKVAGAALLHVGQSARTQHGGNIGRAAPAARRCLIQQTRCFADRLIDIIVIVQRRRFRPADRAQRRGHRKRHQQHHDRDAPCKKSPCSHFDSFLLLLQTQPTGSTGLSFYFITPSTRSQEKSVALFGIISDFSADQTFRLFVSVRVVQRKRELRSWSSRSIRLIICAR